MKKLLFLFFAISLTLSACGTASTQPAPPTQTGTPTITPTTTQTPTSTITPLPTIPAFTPTFDVSTIVTVTPAEKAECPKEDPSVVAKFAKPNSDGSFEQYSTSDILDYLNSGGTATQLRDSGIGEVVDLNGDGVNEVVYRGIIRFAYIILGCQNGEYQEFLHFIGDSGADLIDILDLNKDGTPEIILYNFVHYGFVEVYIFEWDGNKFNSLINMGKDLSTDDRVIDWASTTLPHQIIDINNDGLKEIIVEYDFSKICGGFLGICDGMPTRIETTILGWNGQNYVIQQRYYAPAQYRFQAIQDGDRQTNDGDYAKALSSYRAVISDNDLEWWSPEREEYERYTYMTQYDPTPVVSPTPIPDSAEYPSLAAYAYYRIMLLHLVQGQETEAASTYQTLKDTFGTTPYAAPYIEMATEFWEAYQSTQKMYDGCAAAIQYAVEHPEILIPLGSDYHGWQSHIYVPADVCPFR